MPSSYEMKNIPDRFVSEALGTKRNTSYREFKDRLEAMMARDRMPSSITDQIKAI